MIQSEEQAKEIFIAKIIIFDIDPGLINKLINNVIFRF